MVNEATWTARTGPLYLLSTSEDPGGPTFDFVDISDTGSALDLSDDEIVPIDLPVAFDFEYYGTPVTFVGISNNGGVRMNSADYLSFFNEPLPNVVGSVIFPFWDDLYPFDADGNPLGSIYYETLGAAPNRAFVVQWHNRPHIAGSPSGITFQAILFEGSNNILFQYADVDFDLPGYDNGESATVGINLDAETAIQYSYESPSLSAGLAILFEQNPAFQLTSASDTATVNSLDSEIQVEPESHRSHSGAGRDGDADPHHQQRWQYHPHLERG